MNGSMTRQTFKCFRIADELPFDSTALSNLFQFRDLIHRLVEGHFQFGRYQLGDAIHFAVRQTEYPAYITDGRFGAHGAEGDDLGDALLAIFFHHIIDDLVPFPVG